MLALSQAKNFTTTLPRTNSSVARYTDWNEVKNSGGTALYCLNSSAELAALLYETIAGMSKADQDTGKERLVTATYNHLYAERNGVPIGQS